MPSPYSFSSNSWTPTATADTVALTSNKYQAITLAAAPVVARVTEVYEGGESASSAVNIMVLARDSTVGAATTALGAGQSVTSNSPSSRAAQSSCFVAATTNPQRDVARHLLDLSFNPFGGLVRWVAYPGEEIYLINGGTNSTEVSLSGFTGSGTGQMSSHIIFEEL